MDEKKLVNENMNIFEKDNLEAAYEEGFEDGKRAEQKRICKEVLKLSNPYPEDIFISVEGKAARNAFDVAIEKVLKILEDEVKK